MLPGATGMNPAGILEKARNYHDMPAGFYREAGYMTLVLAPRECGSAYGQDDLADVIDVVDWLNRAGKATLGVERIYVWGYSTGGMLAMLLNRHRPVQAMVSLAGLSSPAQFGAFPFFYGALSGMFSRNAAFCQLGATMGTLGGAEWNVLDNVAHLEEFTSPMLFVHGTGDLIITTANTWAVADRYGQLLASGTALPLMEFMYPPLLDHFTIIRRPDVIARVIEFFEQFEPARP